MISNVPAIAEAVARVPFWNDFDGADVVDSKGDNCYAASGRDHMASHWDYVKIDGIKTPGRATVKCSPQTSLDKQKVAGRDGATVVSRGKKPANMEIVITVWTQPQWSLLLQLLEYINARPGKRAPVDRQSRVVSGDKSQASLLVEHPALSVIGVGSMVVEGIEAPVLPGDGTLTISIKGIQHIPPSKKDATKKIKGAGAPKVAPEFDPTQNSPGGSKPSQNDAGPRPAVTPSRGPY
jgi:hypothetical protein